jgi:hypothetical protein
VKLKKLSVYVKQLEKAFPTFIDEDTVGATGAKKETLICNLSHPDWETNEGRIDFVTHEIVHQVHTPNFDEIEDPAEQKRLEDEVIDLTPLLRQTYTMWDGLVLAWLTNAFYKELMLVHALNKPADQEGRARPIEVRLTRSGPEPILQARRH